MKRLNEIWTRRTTRAYGKKKLVTQKHMEMFFQAAMRAPSSYNMQPWRFWFAEIDSPQGQHLLSFLVAQNASWAKDADWIVLVGAAKSGVFRGELIDNPMASFDTGAACLNFALQVTQAGFGSAVVGGFDRARATAMIDDPAIEVQVMILVGSSATQEAFEVPREPLNSRVFELSYSD